MKMKFTVDWMMGSVFARKCFVCIEQEEQWSAEHGNVLCRLKNQA
jgi:hypothetical protein